MTKELVILLTEEYLDESQLSNIRNTLNNISEETGKIFVVLPNSNWKVIGNVSVREIVDVTDDGNFTMKELSNEKCRG